MQDELRRAGEVIDGAVAELDRRAAAIVRLTDECNQLVRERDDQEQELRRLRLVLAERDRLADELRAAQLREAAADAYTRTASQAALEAHQALAQERGSRDGAEAALRAALRRYGHHEPNCRVTDKAASCTCGLGAATS